MLWVKECGPQHVLREDALCLFPTASLSTRLPVIAVTALSCPVQISASGDVRLVHRECDGSQHSYREDDCQHAVHERAICYTWPDL